MHIKNKICSTSVDGDPVHPTSITVAQWYERLTN